MDSLVRAATDLRQFKFSLDDDMVDRLNRQYTAAVFILLAVFVSARQFFGEAIHCWCPEVCPGNHEKYANLYCWIDDTFYVAFEDDMPQRDEGRDRKITYYQWVPIILMAQAGLFVIPYGIWRFLSSRSGIDLTSIVEASIDSQKSEDPDQRQKKLRYAVHLLDRYLLANREYRMGCPTRLRQFICSRCAAVSGRIAGNYLTCSYVFVKILYVANSIGQIFLLDMFLGYKFHLLGLQVIRHLMFGDTWTPSERFPRVSMCDYRIRQNTNVHRYTVQCAMPINIFNEKIFTIVWFWLLIVGTASVFGFVHWICQMVDWPTQYRYVRRRLSTAAAAAVSVVELPDTSNESKTLMSRFADMYLRRDGLFVLKLVAKNAGEMVSSELLAGLWDAFTLKHQHTMVTAPNGVRDTVSGRNGLWSRAFRKASKISQDEKTEIASAPQVEEV